MHVGWAESPGIKMTAMLGQSTVVCGSSCFDPVFALGSMPKCRYFRLLALRLVLSAKVPSEGGHPWAFVSLLLMSRPIYDF